MKPLLVKVPWLGESSTVSSALVPVITTGHYTLEVRRGEDYGLWYPAPAQFLELTQSFDTNDRLAQGFTLEVPAAMAIAHRDTFTISDGVLDQTFVFIDTTIGGGGGTEVPIYYTGGLTAAQMGNLIARRSMAP